jgi:lysophospholipase L1-like esterase
VEESKALSRQYEALAERLSVRFADAGEWEIPLAFDGVHFTEAGHTRCAEGLTSYLSSGEEQPQYE